MLKRYLPMLGLMSLMPIAHADIIYTLNQGGSCCGSGVFGTIDLHIIDANTVEVTETLTPGNVFAFTGGPGNNVVLDFNIDEAFTIVANSLTAGFVLGGADTPSPFPAFTSSIRCADPCPYGTGTSPPPFLGPLTFQVTNLTGLKPSDFVPSGTYIFASDIGVPNANSPSGFSTGNVAALNVGVDTRGTDPPGTPEPSSVILYATGLTALLLLRNKIIRKRS